MNDVLPVGSRVKATPAGSDSGTRNETAPGTVVASEPGTVAIHLPGGQPLERGRGVFLSQSERGRMMIAAASVTGHVADVLVLTLLSSFRTKDGWPDRRHRTNLQATVIDSGRGSAMAGSVTEISATGMRILVLEPPASADLTVSLHAGAAKIAFPCDVQGTVIGEERSLVHVRFQSLGEQQLGILQAILDTLNDREEASTTRAA